MTASMATMASSISNFLETRAGTSSSGQPSMQPPLKHYTMWANFDKLISKFDDEEVSDLNIDLMVIIGQAIRKKRDQIKE